MLPLAWWFPASKITPSSLELGLKLVSAFSLWPTYLTTSAGWICKGWEQQMQVCAFKVSCLAAWCPFSTFKIFTAESLDSLRPLLGKSAEVADSEILLWPFFPGPAWGFGGDRAQGEGCWWTCAHPVAVDPRTAVWSVLAFAHRAAVRASSSEANELCISVLSLC